MSTTRAIRQRIASVRKVAQMTRALQLVASTKLRRAQLRVFASQPYSNQLTALLARLAAQTAGQEDLPLLHERPINRVGIVLVSPDRGKAGALPANINRHAVQLALDLRHTYDNPALPVGFIAVGRKGRDFLTRTHQRMLAEFTDLGDVPAQENVRALARAVSDAYLSQEMDQVFLVYPQFISAMLQRPTAVRLLPIQPPEDVDLQLAAQYIFEPDPTTIMGALLPQYLETQLHQALLETAASFYAAQMIAMRTATDNATELLEDLALTYSKARQTAITTQILEIVTGAGDGSTRTDRLR